MRILLILLSNPLDQLAPQFLYKGKTTLFFDIDTLILIKSRLGKSQSLGCFLFNQLQYWLGIGRTLNHEIIIIIIFCLAVIAID